MPAPAARTTGVTSANELKIPSNGALAASTCRALTARNELSPGARRRACDRPGAPAGSLPWQSLPLDSSTADQYRPAKPTVEPAGSASVAELDMNVARVGST